MTGARPVSPAVSAEEFARTYEAYYADSLSFEGLATACEEERRWDFLCVTAPLRIEKGTGSPVNPIAIF
jgi:kynurenine formamidase